MSPLFGTDGLRGRFGEYPLDRSTVVSFGQQLARLLRERGGEEPPQLVLGGDTRFSTPKLVEWLCQGLAAGGARWRYCGVIPTPGVAWLTRALGADCGVAISASHNPFPDNGLKLIAADGFKWPRQAELELERRLRSPAEAAGEVSAIDLAADSGIEADLVSRYLDALAASVPGDQPLAAAPLRIALDTGHGAASALARPLFERLGAEVTLLHAAPDGRNINHGCGSTHPEVIAAAVRDGQFDLGVAFDGDADRAIVVDEQGTVRDGDAILYLWARRLAATGALAPRRIVATSMSNLGLERALAAEQIEVVRCGVGDRVVVETMRQHGLLLGGEQSGHIVHLGLSTTGDGLLTALQVAAIVASAGAPVSALLAGFRRFPQVLLNVQVERKPDFATLPAVQRAAAAVEAELGSDGRLVLRYSGTEPLARVMIEGPEQAHIEALARRLASAISSELAS
jgi:phosphoglucosamine mutase